MTTVDEELIQRIDEAIAAKARQSLDMMRAVLNDTGIRRSRTAMAEAPAALATALARQVEAKQALKNAKAALDDETDVAEMLVARPFETEGNKTWLVEAGERVRTVIAAEQAAIVAALVRKHPAVVAARKTLQDAEQAAALADVDVDVAKATLSITKHDVDAAAAELQLAAAIKREEATR